MLPLCATAGFSACGEIRDLISRCLAAVFACVALAPAALADAQPAEDRFAQSLRHHLQARLENPSVAGAGPAETALIENFYWERNDAPAWLDAERARQLRTLDQLARSHGLDANDYNFTKLAAFLQGALDTGNAQSLARLEILATKRIAQLISDLRGGKVNPVGKKAKPRDEPSAETARLLAEAVQSASLSAFLDGIAPDTYLYQKLRFSLAWHRALLEQGANWTTIPGGILLEPGMEDGRVPLIRDRLGLPAGDYSLLYDEELSAAVAEFQARHLLEPDGLLGKQTVAAMNVSIRDRIDQLRVNLDWQRWAAMPQNAEYLLVNVAHYQLHWMQGEARVWSMRTQVGKRYRPTPTLKTHVSAIMVNPSWTVPPTIFRRDVLPEIQKDPGYLAREQMYVIDRAGNAVDSSGIDWQQVTARNFPYRLRARPGNGNALGKMKFMMPNPYLIYMHDTPSKHLFDESTRAFSSGCIRLEEPQKLAEWLIERQDRVNNERLERAMAETGQRYLGMDTEIPVIVMYATIDLDAEGNLVFARDLYGKDARVLAALDTTETPERRPVRLAGTSN